MFPEHVKRVYEGVKGQKQLAWGEGSQIDFYDQPRAVDFALNAVGQWFDRTL